MIARLVEQRDGAGKTSVEIFCGRRAEDRPSSGVCFTPDRIRFPDLELMGVCFGKNRGEGVWPD